MTPHRTRDFDPPMNLSFDRTVNRSFLNRSAISEVFVTDLHTVDETSSVCAAQLPLYHAYYTDHAVRPEAYDLLLLLECSRQAAIYNESVRDTESTNLSRLVDDLTIDLTRPNAALLGAAPGELALHITTSRARIGRKSRVVPLLEMFIDGQYVGWARIQGTYVNLATFRTLRQRRRGGPPPLSTHLPQIPEGVAVQPTQVGRSNPANVVLSDVISDGTTITARLGLRPRNTSIFDHEYDHVPAMALAEAARQIGLIALEKVGDFDSACEQMRATGLHGTFGRFAELDSPVTVTARRPDAPAAPNDQVTVGVDFEQGGQAVCHLDIRFARSAP